MPNKPQEKFCRDEFDRWVRGAPWCKEVAWDDGSDPPDFWLVLNGQKYAVEVTRITHEDFRTVMRSMDRLVKEAERKAIGDGILSGTYIVSFCGRLPAGARHRNLLKLRLLKYVRQTALLEKAHPLEIAVVGEVVCDIQKLHNSRAIIACGGSPNNKGASMREVMSELTELLRSTLKRKASIPRKMNRPTILIIYDLYALADQNEFIECLKSIPEKADFQLVYVVEDKDLGYVAYENERGSLLR